jgi:glycosyltransferase involved in cell wall biosynthesis
MKIVMVGACPYPVPQGSQVFMGETACCLAGRGHDVRLVVYGYGNPSAAMAAEGGGEEDGQVRSLEAAEQMQLCLPSPDGPESSPSAKPEGQRPACPPEIQVRAVPCPPKPEDLRLIRAACPPFVGTPTASGPHWGKPLHDVALLVALRRAARDADVVCAHNYEALIAALLSGRRPVVYFAHNALADELPHYCTDPAAARRAARLGRWFDNTFPRRATRVIVPHRRLAGYLVLRGCDPARVTVVPPPINPAPFETTQTDPAVIMPPVLYTGNLDAYQNLPLLTAVMERVRAVKPEARLIVASAQAPPPGLCGAEHLAAPDFGAVRGALLEDVIVAVPRVSWSGYPVKMLNTMAAGRPVVCCASAAWPISDGVNGLVVPDNDADAFAAAVLRLMDSPRLRRELGRVARETVLRENAPDIVAHQIEGVIQKAMDEG